jgi:hypothetical protein
MRDLFPGYFAPTELELDELWREATFTFDANVLLGLYKLSNEAQQVFFDALEKLGGRIFLPYQAAHEYVRHRGRAINDRAATLKDIKKETVKFLNEVEKRLQEHSVPKSTEIIKMANQAATQLAEIIDSAIENEPDWGRSDTLLEKLCNVFEGKIGPGQSAFELEGLQKKASIRYAKKIPPGYKDEGKGDPEKYGDAIIWFQLMNFASNSQKPIIFVTRDAKEDWWLSSSGKTIGPRPELVQEMMQTAAVRFHMYSMQRFLEFAQQHFKLKSAPTKKAASEIAEIEKHEEESSVYNLNTFKQPSPQITHWYNGQQVFPNQWYGTPAVNTVMVPIDSWYATSPYGSVPQTIDGAFLSGTITADIDPIPSQSAEDAWAKSKYLQLLPINGLILPSSRGKWTCEILGTPKVNNTDKVCYQLGFTPVDTIGQTRNLNLWVSIKELENDLDWRYKNAIRTFISKWLGSDATLAELMFP